MSRRALPLFLSRGLNCLGPLLLLLTWLLGDGGIPLLLLMGAAMASAEYFYRFSADRLPPPSLILALAPLLLIHYSSVDDFRIRLACFFMLAGILPFRRGAWPNLRFSPWRRPVPGRSGLSHFWPWPPPPPSSIPGAFICPVTSPITSLSPRAL